LFEGLKQGESLYHSAMSCLPQVANAIFKQLGKKGSPPPSRLEFTFTSSFLLLVASWYFLAGFFVPEGVYRLSWR